MRILTLYNRIPFPLRDGGALAVYSMLENLRRAGHELELLCLNPSRNFINSGDIPDQLFHQYRLGTVVVNTEISWQGALLNLFSSQPYNTTRFYSKAFVKLLESRLQEKSYDLVVLEACFMGVYLSDLRRLGVKNIVLRAHNIDHLLWERIARGEKQPLKKLYLSWQAARFKRYELALAQQVNGLVPISAVDANYFKTLGIHKPLHASPMGMNLPEQAVKAENQLQQLGFIGTFDWLPNQEGVGWFLSKCWPLVQQKKPSLQFHLAGRKMPYAFQSMHQQGVIVFGEVPDADAFLRSLQLFIVPLLSGSGIRIKLLQAMALGLPIVSTSVGAEGIPVVNGTHLLLADTPEAFADAIVLLAADPEYAYQLGAAARKLIAEAFDNEQLARELSAFYRDLVHA